MSLIDRLQVTITGGPIGAGVATHYAVAGADHQADFKAFWTGLANIMPTGVIINVPAEGDTLESSNGKLVDVWSGGSPAMIVGGAGGTYPGGVGACITWLTAGIVNGHRVRGRTFVVPLGGGLYDVDGTILDAGLSALRARSSELLGACGEDYLVFHRPTKGGSDGSVHSVVAYRVNDRVSTLRSRR